MPDTPQQPNSADTPQERQGSSPVPVDLREMYEAYLVAADAALLTGSPLPELPAEIVDSSFREQAESGLRLLQLLSRARECVLGPEAPRAGAAVPLERVAHFRLLRELGRGGHGVVYLAVDERLGREVALKVPRPETLVNPELRKRFLREAQAAGQLDHPHLVPVHEVGEEGHLVYIASQYIEGPDLAQWLLDRKTPVPPREAAELVADLADGVEHAHAHGVLHRDIKPSNVLLADDRGRLSPRLTDFGLAKLRELGSDQTQTRTGVLLGTPTYMAPELAAGKLREVGPGTDVYGLGAVLYEVLTGRPPFRGESDADTIHQVVHNEPLDPHRLRPGTPRELAAICQECLEKRPEDRYGSAALLAADLRRYLSGQPTLARPATALDRAWKWAKRRPALAGTTVCLIAALAALVAVSLWFGEQLYATNQALTVALANQRALTDQEKRASEKERAARRDIEGIAAAGRLNRVQQLRDQDRPDRALLQLAGTQQESTFDTVEAAYHRRMVRGEIRRLPAHDGAVLTLAVAPGGRLCASGGADNVVQLWTVADGEPRQRLAAHRVSVRGLVFVGPGELLASAGDDGQKSELLLWEWRTAAQPQRLEGPAVEIAALAASPEGDWLAAVGKGTSGQAEVRVWKRSDGADEASRSAWTLAHTWQPGGSLATAASFAADRRTLLVGVSRGQAGAVGFWDVVAGEPKGELTTSGPVSWVALTTDGRQVLAAGGRRIEAWRWPTREALGAAASDYGGQVSMMAIHPREERLATASTASEGPHRSSVQTWRSGPDVALESNLGTPGADARSVAYALDGRTLLVGGSDGSLRWWDIEAHTAVRFHRLEQTGGSRLLVSKSGARIAVGGAAGALCLVDSSTWKTQAFRRPNSSTAHDGTVFAAALSPDERLLVSGGNVDGHVRLWDAKSGDLLADWAAHSLGVRSLAVSPVDAVAATGGTEETICLWDLAQRKLIRQFKIPGESARDLAFSPDGTMLASAGTDQVLRLWDARDGSPLGQWSQVDGLWSVDFSRDGQVIAVGADEGSIQLRGLDGTAHPQAMGHEADHPAVNGLAFSPDGRLLASGSSDHTVRLWDYRAGIDTLRLHCAGSVEHVAFLPDGKRLLYVCQESNYVGVVELFDSDGSLDLPPTGDSAVFSTVYRLCLEKNFVPAQQRLDEALHGQPSIDGFPFRSLRKLATRELSNFGQQPDPPTCFDLAEDARTAICGDVEGSVAFYDLQTGKTTTRQELPRHEGAVRACCFIPSAPTATTIGDAQVGSDLMWWDYEPFRLTKRTALPGRVCAMTMSRDGRQLALLEEPSAAGVQHLVTIDSATREIQQRLPIKLADQSARFDTLAFSPGGDRIVLGGRQTGSEAPSALLAVFTSEDASVVPQAVFAGGSVSSLVFSPDGAKLGVGSSDGEVRVWTWPDGFATPPLRFSVPGFPSLGFSTDGLLLALGYRLNAPVGYSTQIQLCSLTTGKQAACLGRMTEGSLALRFTGDRIIQAGDYRSIRVFDATNLEYRRMEDHSSAVLDVAFLDQGQGIASIASDGAIAWRDESGMRRSWKPETAQQVAAAALAGNAGQLSVVCGGEMLQYDLLNATPRLTHREDLSLPEGGEPNVLLALDPRGRVHCWERKAKKVVGSWDLREVVQPLTPSDRVSNATVPSSLIQSTWDPSRIGQRSAEVTAIAIGPHGLTAAGLDDGRILLRTEDQTAPVVSTGHTNRVRALAFSPDGRVLASSSAAGDVILHDGRSLERLYPLVTPQAEVTCLRFDSKGARLAAGLADGGVVTWDAP